MTQLTQIIKPLTGLVVLGSLLALGACGEQQQQQQQAAAPAEPQAEKETIVWKLAQTWGTGFPTIVFFCNLGWRSALAADIAQQMGLTTCHIDGGFEAWKAFGGEVTPGKK